MAGPSSFLQPGPEEPFAAERAESDALTAPRHRMHAPAYQKEDLMALLPDGLVDPNVSKRPRDVEGEDHNGDESGWFEPFSCLVGEDRELRRVVAAAAGVFVTYCLVYSLRSPWRAATFPRDYELIGVDFKDALQISWTLAYFFGKSISAPILGGLPRKGRLPLLLLCAALCAAAWGGFALFPRNNKKWEDWGRIGMIMLSAVPLAFFWCTLFRYLEGRDTTEVLGAWLAAAMIVGSGFAKTVGSSLQDNGVSEETLPVVAAGGAFPLLVLGVFWMERLPPPSIEERERKGERVRMSGAAQRLFVAEYWMGFIPVTLSSIALTGLRDFRDVFTADIWKELNDGENMPPWLFTFTEVLIAVLVLLAVAGVGMVKDNEKGFKMILSYCILGAVLLGVVQFLVDDWLWKSQAGQAVWLTVSGLGIFLGYVPVSAVLYDRLIAALGVRATSVFVMSITDALGYAGSVGLLLYRNYDDSVKDMSKHEFFRDSARIGAGVIVVSLSVTWFYFHHLFNRYRNDPSLRPKF
eukprot:Hpha_TRINITY_DN12879_c0_g1::TRINITY_DN12879_c0_g1_i1::g.23957::m.23957